jgi:transcriptional regulator with XRE-family HTH domain
MSFSGTLIKTKAKDAGLTILRLAEQLDVSRQTISSWMKGQAPRGGHLVKLCSLLNMKPSDFFMESAEQLVSVPLHRTYRGKGVTTPMRQASQELAEQYINLFRQVSTASIVPVVRMPSSRTEESAHVIADFLRKESGLQEGKPMDYKSVFLLLSKLGIHVIFRTFPAILNHQSYAFFSRIAGQRVVFVNSNTNVLDLIFQILHETVHAIRDEELGTIDNADEEKFCDKVAELAQFPDFYTNMVAQCIVGGIDNPALLITRLKEVSQKNSHSLWGIYYRLKNLGILKQELNPGGAATNLNKKFPVLQNILLGNGDPRSYVDMLYALSPNFMALVAKQVPDCSTRKFGEWFGLDNSIDASAIMDEIIRRKTPA